MKVAATRVDCRHFSLVCQLIYYLQQRLIVGLLLNARLPTTANSPCDDQALLLVVARAYSEGAHSVTEDGGNRTFSIRRGY